MKKAITLALIFSACISFAVPFPIPESKLRGTMNANGQSITNAEDVVTSTGASLATAVQPADATNIVTAVGDAQYSLSNTNSPNYTNLFTLLDGWAVDTNTLVTTAEAVVNKNQPNGYAGLNAEGKIDADYVETIVVLFAGGASVDVP